MNWDALAINSYWRDAHRVLFNKDCRSMVEIPDETVQCVVTSPPYWGLRKYAGLPDLIWGGDGKCEHQWEDEIDTEKRKWKPGRTAIVGNTLSCEKFAPQGLGSFCSLCGAWKGQLGLEPTPELCISHLVEIMREVRRVLRKDGVVFLNIGDSYMSGGGPTRHWGYADPKNMARGIQDYEEPTAYPHKLIKPKDLCLIPFRLAIALQEDGWWIRSVIIWNKPNPMPESVTDRPTESHEYILMLTKSARYCYDQEAVRTPYLPQSIERSYYPVGAFGSAIGSQEIRGAGKLGARKMVNLDRGYKRKGRGGNNPELGNRNFLPIQQHHGQNIVQPASGSNVRSVWTFSTQSYKEAHFATFPEELVRRCVKAATSEVGSCGKCGKPWARIINTKAVGRQRDNGIGTDKHGIAGPCGNVETQTLGWKAQCSCKAPAVPSTVLDPFVGSGTTLKVAAELNRRAIGYELSEQYCKLAVERNKQGIMV